jgi:glyoxylase-like metal-dependent hydrolase (beta-lactamase superfamily II)
MKIASGLEMLEISANIIGMASFIYPTLIWDNDTAILADTGFPGQLPQIREAIERAGVPFEKLSMVILTHHDIDHIGSAAGIIKELPDSVKILAHEVEEPYVNGEKIPIKLAQLEANLNSLPDEMKSIYEKLRAGFQSSKVNVDRTLKDGEELPYCGGISVIFTPGHTLGHICLYHKQSKTLIAGDILDIDGGKLVTAKPSTNFNMELNRKSLKKLASYDIDRVICYHGGLYTGEVKHRVNELADGLA